MRTTIKWERNLQAVIDTSKTAELMGVGAAVCSVEALRVIAEQLNQLNGNIESMQRSDGNEHGDCILRVGD